MYSGSSGKEVKAIGFRNPNSGHQFTVNVSYWAKLTIDGIVSDLTLLTTAEIQMGLVNFAETVVLIGWQRKYFHKPPPSLYSPNISLSPSNEICKGILVISTFHRLLLPSPPTDFPILPLQRICLNELFGKYHTVAFKLLWASLLNHQIFVTPFAFKELIK